jgi:hypothetical protein
MPTIIEHLNHHIRIRNRVFENDKPTHLKYSCIEDFVLKHGHHFKNVLEPTSHGYEQRELKQCFKNSYQLALESGGELIYCEGFALNVFFPVIHAWCIDLKGRVIDVTWDKSKLILSEGMSDFEYFGIPFDFNFVCEQILKSKHYGILDCWELDFPHIRGEWDDLPFIDQRWSELKSKLE